MTNPFPALFLIIILLLILAGFLAKKYSFLPVFLKPGKKVFDLDELIKIENQTEIIIVIDTYLNKKSDYGEKIDKLNPSQKTFLLIENLEREINNGGFLQFYLNSSGDFSHETVNALLEIGANETARIVEKSNSEFPNGSVPKKRAERINILDEIEDQADPSWNKSDSEFLEYKDDLSELIIKFVIKNKTEFKK